MNKADRAKQFMPFASLRGYYDIIRERERTIAPRRELSEDEAAVLDAKLREISRGDMVNITFYRGGAYETLEGMVSEIDLVFGTLTVVKTRIPLPDVFDVEIVKQRCP